MTAAIQAPAPEIALDLVLARVRLRARRHAAWLKHLWAAEAPSDAHAEIEAHLSGRDSPATEAAWVKRDPGTQAITADLSEVEAALDADADSPLARLVGLFGLDDDEADVVHGCVAASLDPAIARVYAYLNDHPGRAYLTDALAGRLFDRACPLALGASSGAIAGRLVARVPGPAGEPDALVCDPVVASWLAGRPELDPALLGRVTFQPTLEPLAGWPVDEVASLARCLLQSAGPGPVRLRVLGAEGSGRRTFAAAVGARLGLALLVVDADGFPDREWEEGYARAQRQALLDGCAVAWHGESLGRRGWPSGVPEAPVQFLITEEVGGPPAEPAAELVAPSLDERDELVRRVVPGAAGWRRGGLATLVRRQRLLPADVAAIARRGAAGPDEAAEAVRAARRDRLGDLAEVLATPFRWEELVVAPAVGEALEDMRYEADAHAEFWERPEARRLFPLGRGLLALFSGAPGTGKTMAAQVLAAALDRDLVRVDISRTISKWVGETSKNLQRVLRRAAGMDAVLLFDEADALFSRRTSLGRVDDASGTQARLANADTSFLLQAIEDYPGVCVLATNQKANIDPAFLRRLRYVLEFTRPGIEERGRIWHAVVAGLADEEAAGRLTCDLERLAAIEATGAQIKLAVLSGLFTAGRLGAELATEHLIRGLDRELVKEGRGLSGREREGLLSRAA